MNIFNGKAALAAATGLVLSAMVPASASAADVVFNFASGGSSSGSPSSNTYTFNSGGVSVQVKGYNLANSTTFSRGAVVQYSNNGLGVVNTYEDGSSPNHTVDNSGSTDILVLQFSTAVTVDKLNFSAWGDTDISWAIGNTATAGITFGSWAQLDGAFPPFTTSSGGSMSDGSNFTRDINGSNLSGNLLYLSAALPNPDSHADYVKLKGLTLQIPEQTTSVPEPATWALMIAGIGAVGVSMRRRSGAVSFA